MKDHLKAFQKEIEALAGRYHLWQVFEDWVEVAAIELAQPGQIILTGQKNPGLESRYLEIVGRYTPEEVRGPFARMFTGMVAALEQKPQDFLGQIFMELDLGSHWHGQFFTPYCVSEMIAEMALQEIPDKDVVTISEPACGSGGMLIAAAEVLKKFGVDPMYQAHAEAVDIDPTCFYMAYSQLSLMGISAEVVLGNTLAVTETKRWRTIGSVMSGHTMNSLSRRPITPVTPIRSPVDDPDIPIELPACGQMTLESFLQGAA